MAGTGSAGRKGPSRLRDVVEWVAVVAVAVAVAVFVRAYVAEPFEIPTESMVDTIQVGDRVLGEKVSYLGSGPAAGDVVTFHDPEQPSTTLIKRVIATPGQTVDIRDGAVYVDGERLDEPYTGGKPTEPIEGRHAAFLDGDPRADPQHRCWAARRARVSWSAQEVGRRPQVLPSRSATISSTGRPAHRVPMALRLPSQPPSKDTERRVRPSSSSSIWIAREQTPRGAKSWVVMKLEPFRQGRSIRRPGFFQLVCTDPAHGCHAIITGHNPPVPLVGHFCPIFRGRPVRGPDDINREI